MSKILDPAITMAILHNDIVELQAILNNTQLSKDELLQALEYARFPEKLILDLRYTEETPIKESINIITELKYHIAKNHPKANLNISKYFK